MVSGANMIGIVNNGWDADHDVGLVAPQPVYLVWEAMARTAIEKGNPPPTAGQKTANTFFESSKAAG